MQDTQDKNQNSQTNHRARVWEQLLQTAFRVAAGVIDGSRAPEIGAVERVRTALIHRLRGDYVPVRVADAQIAMDLLVEGLEEALAPSAALTRLAFELAELRRELALDSGADLDNGAAARRASPRSAHTSKPKRRTRRKPDHA